MQIQQQERPNKFFLQQILDEHPAFRKSKEEELRKQWLSTADHVCSISKDIIERYFDEEERDRLGLTLREFWHQLTNAPMDSLRDLPDGDRFLFYGSPRTNWLFSCMLNLVTDASQACIMKTKLFIEPILRRLLLDLVAHIEPVTSTLLTNDDVKLLSTCATCDTVITSGSVFMNIAPYIMAPYSEMGVVARCDHTHGWGFGKRKISALRQKVTCASCAAKYSTECRIKVDESYISCCSEWIVVPFNVYNAILAIMNQDILEMPKMNTDATSRACLRFSTRRE